ncbi:MFS transporter [Luedemannella flava]|uniref:MFS transporter n=1 Tax=Luedemannella flava TaxID=349316 RepID=A0ABP4Y0E9_9ACTN
MTTTNAEPARAAMPAGLVRLWTAVGVSSLGDGAFLAAVPLAAATITRDPTAVAAVTAAMYLPWVLVQPFAGALLDRWRFRTVMLTADFLRAAGVGTLAVLVATGQATIPLLAMAAFGMVLGQVFHDGAVHAVVPELVGRDGPVLDRANGRIYSAENAGKQLIGPPLGSLGYAVTPWLPFAADAVSFLISGAALSRIPAELRTPSTGERPAILRAVWSGIRWLALHAQLRLSAVIASAGNLAYNAAWATFVLLATDEHGLDVAAAGFGLLISAYAVGGVLGSPVTGWFNRRLGPSRTILLLALAHGLAWPLIALTANAWLAAPLLAVIGAAQTMTTVTNVGLRQSLAPAELLSRVNAAFRTLVNSASPVGALIGGVVATAYGLRAPLFVAGAALLAVALLAGPALWTRTTSSTDSMSH